MRTSPIYPVQNCICIVIIVSYCKSYMSRMYGHPPGNLGTPHLKVFAEVVRASRIQGSRFSSRFKFKVMVLAFLVFSPITLVCGPQEPQCSFR